MSKDKILLLVLMVLMIVVVQPKKTVYHLKFAEGAQEIVCTVNVEITHHAEVVTTKDVEMEIVLKFAG